MTLAQECEAIWPCGWGVNPCEDAAVFLGGRLLNVRREYGAVTVWIYQHSTMQQIHRVNDPQLTAALTRAHSWINTHKEEP